MFLMKEKINLVLILFSIFISNIAATVQQSMTTQYIIIQLIWLICVQKLNIDYILNRFIHADHENY